MAEEEGYTTCCHYCGREVKTPKRYRFRCIPTFMFCCDGCQESFVSRHQNA